MSPISFHTRSLIGSRSTRFVEHLKCPVDGVGSGASQRLTHQAAAWCHCLDRRASASCCRRFTARLGAPTISSGRYQGQTEQASDALVRVTYYRVLAGFDCTGPQTEPRNSSSDTPNRVSPTMNRLSLRVTLTENTNQHLKM